MSASTYALIPGETHATCRQCPEGAICDGTGFVKPKPGWWLAAGLDRDRKGCAPDPRAPPKDCSDGLCDNKKGGNKGQYYDACGIVRNLFRCDVFRSHFGNIVCNPDSKVFFLGTDRSSNRSSNSSGRLLGTVLPALPEGDETHVLTVDMTITSIFTHEKYVLKIH